MRDPLSKQKMKNKSVIAFDLDGTLGDIRTNSLYVDIENLKTLGRNYRLGLVTGSPLEEVRELIQNFPGPFDENLIVTIENTGEMKATGKPFQEFLERINSARVIFIGDSDGDEEGCRKAGLPFVRIRCMAETTLQERRELLSEKIEDAREFLENI